MQNPVYPETLWNLLVARAHAKPDGVLVEDDRDRTLTATQWVEWAERVAAGLQAMGVKSDTVVSWQLPTVIESCVLMMAISRLGGVSNPVLPLLRLREVGFIVDQTGSELLVTPRTWRNFSYANMAAEISRTTGVQTLVLDDGLPEADPASLPAPPSGEGDPVRHIYYTSGSTADPKGALHSDRSAMNGATACILGWALSEDDRIAIPYPYTHIGGFCVTVSAMYTGAQLLFTEIFDAVRSPLVMSKKGATLLGSAVPFYNAYLNAQLEHGAEPLYPRLKAFNGGGAPKPPELYYELKRVFGVGIVSTWGLTEFPSASSGAIEDSDDDLALTEGRVSPGVDIRVVDLGGEEVGMGIEGELRLRGPQCCKGYVDRTLDEAAFDEQGYFCTGDLGILGPRGHVRITGRSKDVIIRNAENISAQEVEDLLYEHPAIADVAVVGVPHPATGERACAVVVLEAGEAQLSLADLAEFCRGRGLANQKIPERIEIVDALPRNALGKILKRELRATYG
jgi:acyl-CoA synthetase (AMP-forming)/AMP-acid ligase II